MKQPRLSKPYEGDDVKDFINQNKTHRSSAEAFKGADYAKWFEKDEMNDMKLFVTEFVLVGLPLIAIGIAVLWWTVQYVVV